MKPHSKHSGKTPPELPARADIVEWNMQSDRRTAQRVKVNLRARWEGETERREATVTSISFKGCFLLSGGQVRPKELIRLEIDLPNEEPLYAWAEVVDQADEIGFAVQFTLIEDDQARLAELILQST